MKNMGAKDGHSIQPIVMNVKSQTRAKRKCMSQFSTAHHRHPYSPSSSDSPKKKLRCPERQQDLYSYEKSLAGSWRASREMGRPRK
jgi:hypothetical protein